MYAFALMSYEYISIMISDFDDTWVHVGSKNT